MVVSQSGELGEKDFTLNLACPEAVVLTCEDAERAHILRIIEECRGNQRRAAQVLAINRLTLHKKLKSYGWKKTRSKRQ